MTKRDISLVLAIWVFLAVIGISVASALHMNLDQSLSLGQLIIEAALVPIAVIGFSITLREFRRSRAVPSIAVLFSLDRGKESSQGSLALPPSGAQGHTIRVTAQNEAERVAVWWQLSFTVPRQLFYRPPGIIAEVWFPEELGGTFTTISKPEGYQIAFLSNGQTALFAHAPLDLGTLHFTFHSAHNYASRYEIPYEVITDRTRASHGKFILNVGGNVSTDPGSA